MLIANVKVQIVVSFEASLAEIAGERFFFVVSLQVAFQVRLGWE